MMLRRYTFRLYPTAAQDAVLRDQARMCGELWNGLLDLRKRTVALDDGQPPRRFDDRNFNRWDIDDELHEINARTPFEMVEGREGRERKSYKYTKSDAARRNELFKRLTRRRAEARRVCAGVSGARKKFDARMVDVSDLDARIANLVAGRQPIAKRRGKAVYAAEIERALKPLRKSKADRIASARIAAVGASLKAATAFDQNRDITALRAACPEWAAIPRGTQERVAEMLDLAFKAFLSGDAGYPKFKRIRDRQGNIIADSVHLREPAKSSWSFAPSKSAIRGCPSGSKATVSANAKSESSRKTKDIAKGPCGDPENAGERQDARRSLLWRAPCGDPENAGERQVSGQWETDKATCGNLENAGELHVQSPVVASDQACGDSVNAAKTASITYWTLKMRGVPGLIEARGRFPAAPLSHKTSDIRFERGAWYFSICVEMAARRQKGEQSLKVEFDLIDSFASVTDANGECLSGLSDPFSKGGKGESSHRGNGLLARPCGDPANEGERQAVEKASPSSNACGDPANEGERQVNDTMALSRAPCGDPANEESGIGEKIDALQSERDLRFKKFSNRWRRYTKRIAALKAKQARKRSYDLHVWTTTVAAKASELEIIAPPKRALRSGRGDETQHGAQVQTIANLNRHVLEMAPASAIRMLEYKTAESGAPCATVRREDHEIRVGGVLRAAAVSVRKAKRTIRKAQTK